MQYVALVECLQLVRKLAAKAGRTVAAAKAAEATGKDGDAGGSGGAAVSAAAAAAAGPAAVKGMEDLAHALGALEALVSEGAGDTSASGERDRAGAFCLRGEGMCKLELFIQEQCVYSHAVIHTNVLTADSSGVLHDFVKINSG